MTDIRWKQRLQNFDRAFVLLRSGLESKELAVLHEWLLARSVQP